MNWEAINIKSILEVLREIEKNSITLTPEQSITYSDGKEEVTITYRRIE